MRHEPGQSPLVLVVEDDPDAREMYEEVLATASLRAVGARDGHEALEKAFALQPALILLDLSLPGISGWELAERLRADDRTKGTPIVLLTGYTLESQPGNLFDACLVKPCLPHVMLAEVERLLARGRSLGVE